MMKAYYDLHIHSCLSPCADDGMTPNNIVNMARILGLNVIALTDHNSVLNAEPTMELAEKAGILCVPGMELTTAEDIHVICLFETLSGAKGFAKYAAENMPSIPSREHIWGRQTVMDACDRVTAEYPYLLPVGTFIRIGDVVRLAGSFSGIAYPAHIDREYNGVISCLGAIPAEAGFRAAELSRRTPADFFTGKKYLGNYNMIYSSDAHALDQMREPSGFFELEELTIPAIFDKINKKSFKLDK